MKKNIIVVPTLLIALLMIGCGGLPPSEYPADIKGDVKSVGFIKNYILKHPGEKLVASRGSVLWVVDISVKNKDYPEPIYGDYSYWVIEGSGSVYSPPKILAQMARLMGKDFGACSTGQTEQLLNVFEVPNSLALSDAQLVYQGQKPYSYGGLRGGEEVTGYDLLSKKVITASQVYNIATTEDMWVSAIPGWVSPYELIVEVKPIEAEANKIYKACLYENSELRATVKVGWNQPEVNVSKVKLVRFPITKAESAAYLFEEVSHIFEVKVCE